MPTVAHNVKRTEEEIIPRALIADDQADVLEALRLLLKGAGYHTEAANSPAAVLEALKHQEFDLLLMDLNYARDTTSGQEGLDLVTQIQALDDPPPIVVMTAWGTIELAVEAMHRGVGDFVLKPWDNRRLLEIARAQIEQRRAQREAQRLEAERTRLERREREREFEEAREIQQGFLPKQIPQFPGCSIAAACRPARSVGGDYFDILPFADRRFALCIADVMGKGVPAALLMSNLQATVRGLAAGAMPPGELCRRANRFLCANGAPDRFITFFYGMVDAPANRLVYVNAGHNAPILLRGDGVALRLHEGGSVLGMFAEDPYEQHEVKLASGDCLVLFTDGVTEARNAGGEEFGEKRLLALLREFATLNAAGLQEKILNAVAEFSEGELDDDATLIVLAVE